MEDQISFIVAISVSIAMYCLLQLYLPIARHLAPHKPILKLFAVKAVGMSYNDLIVVVGELTSMS